MDTRRLTELIGAFLLGGGLVAVTYELASRRGGDGADVPVSVANGENAGPNADDGDGMMGIYGRAGSGSGAGGAGGTATNGGTRPVAATAAGGAPTQPYYEKDDSGAYINYPPITADRVEFDSEAEAQYPSYGLVETGAVLIREQPDLESKRLGLLRAGAKVRLDAERTFGGGCKQGWRKLFPKGWICLDAGLRVGDSEIDDGMVYEAQPALDSPLPYDYWRVNHDGTPFFHRLPSYSEQDDADAAAKAWLAAHGREPMPTSTSKRPSEVPAVVKEYLNAAYYVTVASEHVKAKRRFVRTNRGVYARKYQLAQKNGSDFRGQIINGEEDLPLYWVVRELPLMKREEPGSGVLIDTGEKLERRTTYEFDRKVRIGDYDYYEDKDGNLLRAYAVGKSYKLKRPVGLTDEDRWVHIDLSEQTLVAYEGNTPVFTTLVSTGKEKGMTPVGVHRVQSKFVATSMRDQPQEDEAYSIEDVPWTQYFSQNVALHGAFWHGGFGLVRSHGCVNLSPSDARWLFGFLEPHLPEGWHAAMAHDLNGDGSVVVVTE